MITNEKHYIDEPQQTPHTTRSQKGTGNTLASQKEGFQTTKQCLQQNLLFIIMASMPTVVRHLLGIFARCLGTFVLSQVFVARSPESLLIISLGTPVPNLYARDPTHNP